MKIFISVSGGHVDVLGFAMTSEYNCLIILAEYPCVCIHYLIIYAATVPINIIL